MTEEIERQETAAVKVEPTGRVTLQVVEDSGGSGDEYLYGLDSFYDGRAGIHTVGPDPISNR